MKKVKQAHELITDNLIGKHYAGSYAYGTNIATSDVDFRGIFVADPIHIRTPFYRIDEAKDTSEEDTVIYELNQFMKLALDCNPNVIETLWVDDSSIVHTTQAYQYLRQMAPQLLNANIAFRTAGYAFAQLKRIKGHNKWINNPQPVDPPKQIDFVSLVHNFTPDKIFKIDLTAIHKDHRLVPYSGNIFGVYRMEGYESYNEDYTLNTIYDGDTHALDNPLYIIKFNKDEYNQKKDIWANYWSWKKNRNVARSELEEHFGYDTKHAMHLVRLMRMGAEALDTGCINVKRPDADELLSIRNGAWTYDQVIEYAEYMDDQVRNVLYKQTALPKKPNIRLAAQVVMDVQNMVWN